MLAFGMIKIMSVLSTLIGWNEFLHIRMIRKKAQTVTLTLNLIVLFVLAGFQCTKGADFYITTTGNDAAGSGSRSSPWRTLSFACTQIQANLGHTIWLSAGTFTELQIALPAGVNIRGAGKDQTILKADPSVFFNPTDPGFGTDKFLINLNSSESTDGNQSIKNLTIDGDRKKLHGGLFVHNRYNIIIENIRIQQVNFCGIWLWDVKDSGVRNVNLKDCAWGSTGWCSGALQLTNASNIDIAGFDIDEATGYGIKNLAHEKNTPLSNIKIHDGRISVAPVGAWNNGAAPNITIELWASSFPGTEIFNCYFDNHISLVNYPIVQRTTPIKIYNNIFDILGTRPKGNGYGIELSVYDADVYNNWFNGGITAIVNWGERQFGNWNIHHNIVYGISAGYPTAIINSYKGGLRDVNVFNNTIEMVGTTTVNFIEFNHGGVGENIAIKNNLIMDSNTSYTYYPNRFINLEKDATIKNLTVDHNFLYKLPIGNITGSYSNNLSGDPKIIQTGPRPNPYYFPTIGSPLIDAGTTQNATSFHKGVAPDIGAFENR